ncbi:MBL fold metallo-hydrolase [Sphaerisporangium fuscum]|uniref:MBL fold metallo-hydrolase n=1 Tax=Sphaerisporangium fuscum TaxID=2835868 RepID=UPI001BDCA530|nr:MBL fold metallo-hydrolase [Sphaerisporangium fuscum]
MRVQLLGTAAGGGVPQWNCACSGCAGARAHPGRRRRHASLAVQVETARSYVVNATPDIGDQIEACDWLLPGPGRRETPLAGVILTDAELDHTLGIARLREADKLELWATPAVCGALTGRLRLGEVLAPYTGLTWHDLPSSPDARPLGGGVEVDAVPLSGKRPRYAGATPGAARGPSCEAGAGRGPGSEPSEGSGPYSVAGAGSGPGFEEGRGFGSVPVEVGDAGRGWVVALRLADRVTGKVLVYAPAMGVWPSELDTALAGADCVIVDGTFWDDEEPRRAGISERTATQMGHLPIEATAERLARLPGRVLYTHLNNTNPLVGPDAPQHATLARLGVEVAAEGTVIEL